MEDCDSDLQKKLDEVMPWIGLYIAAASAICTLAIAADTFKGFRSSKLWFPCKYFSLNATCLTLLGVAMKLPMDLNTLLLYESDGLARVSSLFFMSTAMAYFMSSLGSMEDKDILMNVVALAILVITIVVNVWIQVFQLHSFLRGTKFRNSDVVPTILMLIALVTIVSSAITLPTSKRSLESKYQEMHKVATGEEGMAKRGQGFKIDKRMIDGMKKYWVMAVTSNPQFVMARSVFCTTSGVICLLSVLFLLFDFSLLFMRMEEVTPEESYSVYGHYTRWILIVQTIGVVVGTIAPLCRWFTAVRFKCLMTCHKISIREELKIEAHWTQSLVNLRDSFSDLQIWNNKCRKYLHDAKWSFLTVLIDVQIMMVLVSKLLVLFPALLVAPFLFAFKEFKMQCLSKLTTSSIDMESGSGGDAELNLSRFALLLDGESELPNGTLKHIIRQADKVIEMGEKQQPQNLIHCLNKFSNFRGVSEFDSSQVPSLHSQEPPNCWSLPLVTLTSIAISLPNVANNKKATQLMNSVSEGLSLVKLIEKTLYESDELVNFINAAEVSWVEVALYMKWQGMDLRKLSLKCQNSKNVLLEFSNNAKKTIENFKSTTNGFLMENPLNWPANIIAANSMYRISQTILLSYQEENEQNDEGLFQRLSVMIADILAACFTNLARVIITKCHRNAIERREKSVHEAFLLLGKTTQIFKLLQQHEWPSLDHDNVVYIEEWRVFFSKNNETPMTSPSTSGDEAVTSLISDEEQVTIVVG
ncbi:UNVERIFIED_CONTAM: hypothetical protein Scaly_2767400 [Sesamum calycinum]|uniref:Uncharacterized protein n=1 Tax=Sesamum calycinum TaxID=2727403 RepID=A0AAW2J0R3_9LAMI